MESQATGNDPKRKTIFDARLPAVHLRA